MLAVPVSDDAALTETVARLGGAGIAVTELSLHLPSLDEVFFTLTGRTASDDDTTVTDRQGGRGMSTATAPPQRPRRNAPLVRGAVKPRPFRLVRHSLALTKRSLIKTWRTPEALIDVTLQPALFLVIFVYIFGGAVAGSTHHYLQFLLPGILAQTIATGAIVDRREPQHRPRQGHLRPVPVAADPAVGAADRRGARRRRAVRHRHDLDARVGYLMGFRIHTDPLQRDRRLPARRAVRAVPELAAGLRRDEGAHLRRRAGHHVPADHAAELRLQRVRRRPTTLPGWMQGFVKVNPMTHLVDSMRGLFLGTPVGNHVWWTLAWCAGFVVVFMPLALRAYRQKV